MKSYAPALRVRLIALIALAVMAIAAIPILQFRAASQKTLATATRQYDALKEKIALYQTLRPRGDASASDAGLFAETSKIAAETGVADRLDNLRPSEDGALDLRLRSLYLRETLRFISLIEALPNAAIERLSLRKDANNLLDLELRLKRGKNG